MRGCKLSVTQIFSKEASLATSPGITINKIIQHGTFIGYMDLDTVKTLHHQFHVTPMSGIDAKVLTDPKLKQTTDEKNKQKIKQNPQAL